MSEQHAITVGASASALSALPCEPSRIDWGIQDISSADSGRVQDKGNTMYKMRVSQKVKLSLEWTNPTLQEASSILKAFNKEYFYVRYIDPMEGKYVTRQFYAGDRSAPFRKIELPNGTTLTTVSFDIIER